MSVKLELVITGPGRYRQRNGYMAVVDRLLSRDFHYPRKLWSVLEEAGE